MIKRENKAGLKIIDLGSGCFEGKQIYNYIQSLYYRSPEIILGIQYTSAIDIWSFGCVIVELFLGYPLFSGSNQTEQIALFTELLGEPELSFLGRGNRSYKFFNNTKLINATVKGKHRNPLGKPLKKVLEKCVDKKFVDFVSKCLTWVPQERIKASEALLDDWIISGLPQEIRSQHVKAAQVA